MTGSGTTAAQTGRGHALVVVMPVYNEEEGVVAVVEDWLRSLDALLSDFRILVLNDGSRDGTLSKLRVFAEDARVCVIDKVNEGHGPTILRGYREAVTRAEWVFQVDSDDEIHASEFVTLWQQREGHDFLFGERTDRPQGLARYVVSACSRLVVHALCGRAVHDVNVPFRLMRADALSAFLPQIPADTFAPNLVIAGLAARSHARVLNVPVRCTMRATAPVSLTGWSVWRAALRSLRQSLVILLRRGDGCGS
jgi:glycosyltransferase involved in cell wall biosynthesis